MMRARLLALALATIACRPGGAPRPSPPGATPDPCLVPARSSPAESALVAVSGSIDTGFALLPRSQAESLVVAQVYETLVRVTCDDRIAPALAASSTGDTSGRVWTFAIRDDAAFPDGSPVTGQDVAEAWRARRSSPAGRTDARAGAVVGITIESDRRITVQLRDPQPDGPRLLADPFYAVHRRGSTSATPAGSGPYVAPAGIAQGTAVTGVSMPMRIVPRTPTSGPPLVLRSPRSGDPRDLVDEGIDVMVTSDPRILDYAATRPELVVRPLPPDRVYVLLTTVRGGPTGAPRIGGDDQRWEILRTTLARDVLRTGPATDSRWWGTDTANAHCAPMERTMPAWSGPTRIDWARRIAHPAGDRIAGALARRLVALAADAAERTTEPMWMRGLLPELTEPADRRLVTVPLSDPEIARSLTAGDELAYIIPLPRRALDRCRAWGDVVGRVPWLGSGVAVRIAESGPSLITSARAPSLLFDWDNTLRVVAGTASSRNPR